MQITGFAYILKYSRNSSVGISKEAMYIITNYSLLPVPQIAFENIKTQHRLPIENISTRISTLKEIPMGSKISFGRLDDDRDKRINCFPV